MSVRAFVFLGGPSGQWSNYSTLCPAGPVLRTSGISYAVISGRFGRPTVLDKCVKFHDPCLNHSREIPPEAVGGGIFDSFFSL